jgi:hypothetical protein
MMRCLTRGCFVVHLESLKCHEETSKYTFSFKNITLDPKPHVMIRRKLEDLYKQGVLRNKQQILDLPDDRRWVYYAVTPTEGTCHYKNMVNGLCFRLCNYQT